MRTYRLKPGSVPEAEKRFAEGSRNACGCHRSAPFSTPKSARSTESSIAGPMRISRTAPRSAPKRSRLAAEDPGIHRGDGKQDHHRGAVFAKAGAAQARNLYEIRTYTMLPGATPTVVEKLLSGPSSVCPHEASGEYFAVPRSAPAPFLDDRRCWRPAASCRCGSRRDCRVLRAPALAKTAPR